MTDMGATNRISIVGGGIAGLSAAYALGLHRTSVALFEQASEFAEAGAGIGLGPNAVKILDSWGLSQTLREVGFMPDGLQARDATNGRALGRLPMGQSFIEKYGAPYLTVHRADLHAMLLKAVEQQSTTDLNLNHALTGVDVTGEHIALQFNDGAVRLETHSLIGADGLHSKVRPWIAGHETPTASGHWAYRALLPASDMPLALRTAQIGVWMGKRLHVVHYPVRGGDEVNLVVLIESEDQAAQPGWDIRRSAEQTKNDLHKATQDCCVELQQVIGAAKEWRAWCLFDRLALQSASQMARGRVALLGDAAHPMLPYLAQGAGMAIEDAQSLAMHWQRTELSVEERLQQYAQARWQRVARVQQRARRNGVIFHADGLLRFERDAALKLGGSRLMDMPWLYGG
jgi:salicylate hydroxylase